MMVNIYWVLTMYEIILNSLYVSSQSWQQFYQVSTVIVPILHMGKLKHSEVK